MSGISGLLVREAATADALQDVVPRVVVEPETVAQVSSVMHAASQQGLSVVPRGTGSKLGWADPPRSADVILDLGRLRGVLDHAAGDVVVVARAGTRLAELQETLARKRQWLALDPPEADATLGGLVATNAAGPRQLTYGRPRDLLIGIEVVLSDGSVARSGGRVVKNVAGYDLGKLYAGSLGTLGVIVEVTFRLHPIPEASELFEFEVESEVEGPAGSGRDRRLAAGARLGHPPMVAAPPDSTRRRPRWRDSRRSRAGRRAREAADGPARRPSRRTRGQGSMLRGLFSAPRFSPGGHGACSRQRSRASSAGRSRV